MSGGHYNYGYFHIQELADEIEKSFINDGKKKGWNDEEYDYLNDADEHQRGYILQEAKDLIKDLRNVATRAKELEWFMSGDTGVKSYLARLTKIK